MRECFGSAKFAANVYVVGVTQSMLDEYVVCVHWLVVVVCGVSRSRAAQCSVRGRRRPRQRRVALAATINGANGRHCTNASTAYYHHGQRYNQRDRKSVV